MKLFRRQTILALSAFVIFGVMIYIPFTVFISAHWPSLSLLVKSWKEALLLTVFVLLVWEVTVARKWQEIFADRLIQLITVFMLLHVCLLIWRFQGLQPALAGVEIDLRGMLVFAEMYVIGRHFWPELRGWVIRAGALGISLVAGFSVVQLFLPRDFLSHFGYGIKTIQPYLTVDRDQNLVRENSTLRGPNPLGAVSAMGLLFITTYWWKFRKKLSNSWIYVLLALTLALVVGLVVSYSRSAWLGFVIGTTAWLAVMFGHKISKRVWGCIAIITIIFFAMVIALQSNPFVSKVFFHNNPNGSQTKSDTQHAISLESGLTHELSNPLGFGIGSAGSASLLGAHPVVVENQYLFVGYEAGWAGVVLFVWIFLTILWYTSKRREDWLSMGVFASGICLGVIGLILPVFTDDTTVILWWGLAGVALGSGVTIKVHGRHRTTNKKATRDA